VAAPMVAAPIAVVPGAVVATVAPAHLGATVARDVAPELIGAKLVEANLPEANRPEANRPEANLVARAGPKPTDYVATPVIEAAAVLIAHSKSGVAYRSLVTGADNSVDARSEAVDLVRALAASGREAVLVSWSGHEGVQFDGLQTAAGVSELLRGDVSLDDAVVGLPGSSAKFIGAGLGGEVIDGGAACVLLDALDESFEHVVVYAPHSRAKELFAAIEGRCDAGVLVLAGRQIGEMKLDEFLGFEVPEFLIVPVVRGQRMAERMGAVPVARGMPTLSSYRPLNGRA
jgi:hypothetical protein